MRVCLRKCLRCSLHVRVCTRVCCMWLRVHALVSVQVPEMLSACARMRAHLLNAAARACAFVCASA
jgi:hypothetical protein